MLGYTDDDVNGCRFVPEAAVTCICVDAEGYLQTCMYAECYFEHGDANMHIFRYFLFNSIVFVRIVSNKHRSRTDVCTVACKARFKLTASRFLFTEGRDTSYSISQINVDKNGWGWSVTRLGTTDKL